MNTLSSKVVILIAAVMAVLIIGVATVSSQPVINEATWEYVAVTWVKGAHVYGNAIPLSPNDDTVDGLWQALTAAIDNNAEESNMISQVVALNYMGSLGWELVAMTGDEDSPTFMFKRQVTS